MTDLAMPLDISLPAVSRHLRVLENAGLIVRTRVGREHRIEANPAPIREVREWLSMYATAWEFQFGRLDAYLKAKQRAGSASDHSTGERHE